MTVRQSNLQVVKIRCVKRWLINGVAMLSLALCVATIALWRWSYRQQGWVEGTWCGSSRCYQVSVGNSPGRLSVSFMWQAADAQPKHLHDMRMPPLSAQPSLQTWLGPTPQISSAYDDTLPERSDLHEFAGLACWADNDLGRSWSLMVPHRYVALLAAVLPLRWTWLQRRAKRRTQQHRCAACGYDLRATPDRCPECGAVSSPEPATSGAGNVH